MKDYQMKDGFAVVKADAQEFATYHAVYRVSRINVWFHTKLERVIDLFAGWSGLYWITLHGKKIGGVILEPNWFGFLFLIPPFGDEGTVVEHLYSLLVSISDPEKPITAASVHPESYDYYYRLGFQIYETEKVMARPTAPFEVEWDDCYQLDVPSPEKKDEMVDLYFEVYRQSEVECIADKDREFYQKILDGQIPDVKQEYSTLIYDKETDELIGACLVTIWEELPYINDLVVKSGYQGRGLGAKMIKKVLNNAREEYSAVRLSGREGNRAENLYHRLGFLSGVKASDMKMRLK